MDRVIQQISAAFAKALDRSDYGTAMALLAEDAEYAAAGGTLHGPAAIVASYREHDEWARRNLQSVQYESSVRLESGRAIVTFIDHLAHSGMTHTYSCEQSIWVDRNGLISRIVHCEVAGQRMAVDEFLKLVGVKRSKVTPEAQEGDVR